MADPGKGTSGSSVSFQEGRLLFLPDSITLKASRISSLRERPWALAARSTCFKKLSGSEILTLAIEMSEVEHTPGNFVGAILFIASDP